MFVKKIIMYVISLVLSELNPHLLNLKIRDSAHAGSKSPSFTITLSSDVVLCAEGSTILPRNYDFLPLVYLE